MDISTLTTELQTVFNSLANDAYKYYCTAKKYHMENELEGALINFLLALNNLKTIKKSIFQNEIYASIAHAEKSKSGQSCDLEDGLDQAIATILGYVQPLQDQLKRIKNERAFGQKKDDDLPCTDVKQVLMQGDDVITFDEVSGQEVAKEQIRTGILFPLLYPRLYPNLSKGILFYGPPGTGKTLLARAFVNQLQLEAEKADNMQIRIILYAPKGSELKGKYVGETEKKISAYFKCASKAATACSAETKMKVVSVIFLDEVDAIAGIRTEDPIMTTSVNALLQEMDGVVGNPNVVVMAATNYPWKLDEAVLRRFDTKIYITLPTAADIAVSLKTEIVNKFIKKALAKPKKVVTGDGNGDGDPTTTAAAAAIGACKTNCHNNQICLNKYDPSTRVKPVELFNFYRHKYFPQFTDAQIAKLAAALQERLYSGGDVSNICKHVFKTMGNVARRDGRFVESLMVDPNLLEKNSNGDFITSDVKSECNVPFLFQLFSKDGNMTNSSDALTETPKCICLFLTDVVSEERRVTSFDTSVIMGGGENENENENKTETNANKDEDSFDGVVIAGGGNPPPPQIRVSLPPLLRIQTPRLPSRPETNSEWAMYFYKLTSDDILNNPKSGIPEDDENESFLMFVDLQCVPFKKLVAEKEHQHALQQLCKNILGLLTSCRNHSQKCFYISLVDLKRTLTHKQVTYRILIKQQLEIRERILHFNITKEVFVLINLDDSVLNSWYNPYDIFGKIAGATKTVADAMTGVAASGMGHVVTWLTWSRYEDNFDIKDSEETKEAHRLKALKALEDAPVELMIQLYRKATHIICVEDNLTDTPSSRIYAISSLTVLTKETADANFDFARCLSRGLLYDGTNECSTFVNLFKEITQKINIEQNSQQKKSQKAMMEREKTLNEFLYISGYNVENLLDDDDMSVSSQTQGLEVTQLLKPQKSYFSYMKSATQIATNTTKLALAMTKEAIEIAKKKVGLAPAESTTELEDAPPPKHINYNVCFMFVDKSRNDIIEQKVRAFVSQNSYYYARVTDRDALTYYDENVLYFYGQRHYKVYTFEHSYQTEPVPLKRIVQDIELLMFNLIEPIDMTDIGNCQDGETETTRKITLDFDMSYFMQAINLGNVDSIKPTVHPDTVQNLKNYAENKEVVIKKK